MDRTILFNELPRPTFRWLQVNHTEGRIWGEQNAPGDGSTEASSQNKNHIVTIEGQPGIVTPLADKALLNPEYGGAGTEAFEKAAEAYHDGFAVTVPAGQKERVAVQFHAEGQSLAHRTRLRVTVGEGAELELVCYLTGNTDKESSVQLLTELDIAAGAVVNMKKIQLLGDKVQQIEHRYAKLGKESRADFISVELGGAESFLNFVSDLQGAQSTIEHDLAYLGDGKQRFDISMLMNHIGQKSVSDIHNLGALTDQSKKSFRGTLDFKRGSIASEGAEEDTCLLLNKEVKSISLPLLLCKEDNVVGNHAASAGQIDQNKLYYLMSRGFSEAEAKHIIVESMLRPVIDRLGDTEIEEAALAAMHKKI